MGEQEISRVFILSESLSDENSFDLILENPQGFFRCHEHERVPVIMRPVWKENDASSGIIYALRIKGMDTEETEQPSPAWTHEFVNEDVSTYALRNLCIVPFVRGNATPRSDLVLSCIHVEICADGTVYIAEKGEVGESVHIPASTLVQPNVTSFRNAIHFDSFGIRDAFVSASENERTYLATIQLVSPNNETSAYNFEWTFDLVDPEIALSLIETDIKAVGVIIIPSGQTSGQCVVPQAPNQRLRRVDLFVIDGSTRLAVSEIPCVPFWDAVACTSQLDENNRTYTLGVDFVGKVVPTECILQVAYSTVDGSTDIVSIPIPLSEDENFLRFVYDVQNLERTILSLRLYRQDGLSLLTDFRAEVLRRSVIFSTSAVMATYYQTDPNAVNRLYRLLKDDEVVFSRFHQQRIEDIEGAIDIVIDNLLTGPINSLSMAIEAVREEASEFARKTNLDFENVRASITELDADIRQTMSDTEADIRQSITEMDADIRQAMSDTEADIRQSITEMDADIRQTLTETEADIRQSITEMDADIRQAMSDTEVDIRQSITEMDADIRQAMSDTEVDIRQSITENEMNIQQSLTIIIRDATAYKEITDGSLSHLTTSLAETELNLQYSLTGLSESLSERMLTDRNEWMSSVSDLQSQVLALTAFDTLLTTNTAKFLYVLASRMKVMDELLDDIAQGTGISRSSRGGEAWDYVGESQWWTFNLPASAQDINLSADSVTFEQFLNQN
jgi:hypothetical protein